MRREVNAPELIVEREQRIRDEEAESYDTRSDRLAWELAVEDLVFDAALGLRPGHRVLDAGCGTGRHLPWLLSRASEVVGADHSARSLDVARRRAGDVPPDRLRLVAADLRELPLADGSVDRVLCSETIGHLPTAQLRADAARELLRVLRPGGVLVASGYRWLGHIRRHKDGFFDTGLYRYAFTLREFRALFASAGFASVRVGSAPAVPALARRAGITPSAAARAAFRPGTRALGDFVIARAERPPAHPAPTRR